MNRDYMTSQSARVCGVLFEPYTRGYWARVCRMDRQLARCAALDEDIERVAKWLRFAAASHRNMMLAKPCTRKPLP